MNQPFACMVTLSVLISPLLIMAMKTSYRLEDLDINVKRHFDRHVSRCLVRALVLSALAATVIALFAFLISYSQWMSISAFGVACFICLYITFHMIVPTQADCKQSRSIIMEAAKDPERINDIRPGACAVQTDNGQVHELSAVEQVAWKELVVPFLCKMHSKTLSDQKSVMGHVLSKSEMRELQRQLKAVKEDEVRMEKDRLQLDERRQGIIALQERLANEEKQLKQARQGIDQQAKSLEEAENLVISKLSEIEVAEAQMAQMRDDLESQQNVGQSNASDNDRLKRKEAELDALRLSLQEDKHLVEQQKTELNQLKGDLIRGSDVAMPTDLSAEASLRARELELEAQLSQLETATMELETRSQYVQDVEESLIERMNTMSEREACLEQGEVNAGLREDV